MATTAKCVKDLDKTPKYAIRHRNRCRKCGRPRAYLRKFALCRLCSVVRLQASSRVAGRDHVEVRTRRSQVE
jgi:small subunit ribosomal protein S14